MELELSEGMKQTLELLYQRAKEYNPRLTREELVLTIVSQWLDCYRLNTDSRPPLTKQQAKLKTDLKMAIVLSGKNQKQIAQEIGICHTYLNQVVNGKSEPSISIALLIARALNYPPSKLGELFYLEPAAE